MVTNLKASQSPNVVDQEGHGHSGHGPQKSLGIYEGNSEVTEVGVLNEGARGNTIVCEFACELRLCKCAYVSDCMSICVFI